VIDLLEHKLGVAANTLKPIALVSVPLFVDQSLSHRSLPFANLIVLVLAVLEEAVVSKDNCQAILLSRLIHQCYLGPK